MRIAVFQRASWCFNVFWVIAYIECVLYCVVRYLSRFCPRAACQKTLTYFGVIVTLNTK